MKIWCISFLIMSLLATIAVGQERTWSDNTGKFSIKAEMVKNENQVVHLKKPDGEVIQVPIKRLSDADKAFLKDQISKGKTETDDGGSSSRWMTDVKFKASGKRTPGPEHDYNGNDPFTQIEMQIDIFGKAAAQAFSYGNLKIDACKDADGNDLEVKPRTFAADITKEMAKVGSRGNDFFSNHPPKGVRIELDTEDKSGELKKVAEVSGTLELMTGGKPKSVTINNVSQHENGEIKAELLDELDLKCDFQRDGNQIKLTLTGDQSNLAGVIFLDDKGKEVKPNSWSAGGWKESWNYSYGFDQIPTANLVMEYRLGAETISLPFVVKNIKIKPR